MSDLTASHRLTAKKEDLLLTVFKSGEGWGLRVEEIDDPDGAYAPDTTYATQETARSRAVAAVQELFGYGYTAKDFKWEPPSTP
jgi:hypothetical protein